MTNQSRTAKKRFPFIVDANVVNIFLKTSGTVNQKNGHSDAISINNDYYFKS